ncbi:MAG: anthranilate synthase component I family protein [Flavobacteriales bacterium]
MWDKETFIDINLMAFHQLANLDQWKGIVCCYRPKDSEVGLFGFGAQDFIDLKSGLPVELLDIIMGSGKYWMGYLNYDLKNKVENLDSRNPHPMGFSDAFFFVPQLLLRFSEEGGLEEVYNSSGISWQKYMVFFDKKNDGKPRTWTPLQSKEKYIESVEKLKYHIQRGDIYEINFCQAFETDWHGADGWSVFSKVFEATEAPYSAYLRHGHRHICCGSPELFLKKYDNVLVSSPIKGTIRRGKEKKEDDELKEQLYNDPKERAENVMIVDLVRNDMSRIADDDSVWVDELWALHTFKTVHHLISRISCEIQEAVTFSDIVKAMFPMGSMTGAPKVNAMKFADELEAVSRGVYSGSIGIVRPDSSFEFNVVIRALLLDEHLKKAMVHVGGAITDMCDPEKEYEETLLKGRALMNMEF